MGQRGQSVGRGQVQDSQAGTSSQAGQTICYFCRQSGHMRRDCPRRQRPHGTVTPQIPLGTSLHTNNHLHHESTNKIHK